MVETEQSKYAGQVEELSNLCIINVYEPNYLFLNGLTQLIEQNFPGYHVQHIKNINHILHMNPSMVMLDPFDRVENFGIVVQAASTSNSKLFIYTRAYNHTNANISVSFGADVFIDKCSPENEYIESIGSALRGETYISREMLSLLKKAAKNIHRSGNSYSLTSREIEVLRHTVLGHTSKEMAQTMGVSHRTIETHRYNIRQKTGAFSKAELRTIAHTLDLT